MKKQIVVAIIASGLGIAAPSMTQPRSDEGSPRQVSSQEHDNVSDNWGLLGLFGLVGLLGLRRNGVKF